MQEVATLFIPARDVVCVKAMGPRGVLSSWASLGFDVDVQTHRDALFLLHNVKEAANEK